MVEDRLVPCSRCGRDTPDPEAVCVTCRVESDEIPEVEVPWRPVDRPVVERGLDQPDTSNEAADSALGHAGSDRRRVYDLLVERGSYGATDEEIEHALGLVHQTASARRNGLAGDGWVVDSGNRRTTSRNRSAIVWIATEVAKRQERMF